VIGPVLGIPYQYKFKQSKKCRHLLMAKIGATRSGENGHSDCNIFFPETLHIAGDVETQMLHRGIYDAAVFSRRRLRSRESLRPPDFAAQDRRKRTANGRNALFTIAVNDLRGNGKH